MGEDGERNFAILQAEDELAAMGIGAAGTASAPSRLPAEHTAQHNGTRLRLRGESCHRVGDPSWDGLCPTPSSDTVAASL